MMQLRRKKEEGAPFRSIVYTFEATRTFKHHQNRSAGVGYIKLDLYYPLKTVDTQSPNPLSLSQNISIP